MSAELKAAWDQAEKNKHDGASVSNLVDVLEKECKPAGEDVATRKAALDLALVRALASTNNWKQGNYGRAVWYGLLGVADSYGVVMVFDNSNVGTGLKTVAALLAGAAFSKLAKIIAHRPGGPTVSIAFKPKLPTRRVMVGVDEAAGVGKAWSDLRVWNEQSIKLSGTDKELIYGGDAYVGPVNGGPGKGYSTATVPVSPQEAAEASAAAASQMKSVSMPWRSQLQENMVGPYKLGSQDCTTYSSSVLNAAGIVTPSVSTPFELCVCAGADAAGTSDGGCHVWGVVGTMQTTQDPVPGTVVVTSREWAAQASLPKEHTGQQRPQERWISVGIGQGSFVQGQSARGSTVLVLTLVVRMTWPPTATGLGRGSGGSALQIKEVVPSGAIKSMLKFQEVSEPLCAPLSRGLMKH